MNDLYARAVRLLVRREHTRAELSRKLAPYGSREEIDRVLDRLAAAGLQSDARCAESLVRAQESRYGTARLRQTLRQKGVADALIEAAVADLDDELARARAVWEKKFAAPPADAKEWARQARFLAGRGFSHETIRRLLNPDCPLDRADDL